MSTGSKYPDRLRLDPRDPLNGYVPASGHNLINLHERTRARRRRILDEAGMARTQGNLEPYTRADTRAGW